MPRHRCLTALLCLLVLRLPRAGTADAKPDEKPAALRVLFVGNSFTFVNDLPGKLQKLAASAGQELTVASAVHGGYTFHSHWDNRTFEPALKKGKWDLVVLQGQSQEMSFSAQQRSQQSNPYIQDLAKVFRDHQSQCLLFETWGMRDGDRQNLPTDKYSDMQVRLRQGYHDAAQLISAPIAPVGDAWELALKRRPELDLWANDGRHPSLAGTYLAACVFYKLLYNKSPVGLKFIARLDAETADFLQHVADESVKEGLGLREPQK